MTAPNRLVRLARDGTISYSQRLTLATKCRMNLRYPALITTPNAICWYLLLFQKSKLHCRKFPMDVQHCHVELSSFGYTLSEVRQP